MNIKKFNYMLIPVILILISVPLAVQVSIIEISEQSFRFYTSAEQVDLYIYSKSKCLAIGSGIMVFFSLLMFDVERKRFNKNMGIYFICSIIFIIFTLISSFLAVDREVAFHGFFMNGEGFYNLACYMLVFLYTLVNFSKNSDYKYIAYPLIIVVIINLVLGVMQYQNNDILSTDFGANLITTKEYDYLIENVKKAHVSYSTYMYGTIYHYNYMGTFCSMLIPFFGLLTFSDRSKINKFLFGITTIMLCVLLVGSNARSGIVGIAGVIFFAIVIFYKQILKYWKISSTLILSSIIIAIGANVVTNGNLFARVPSIINDALAIFKIDSDFDFTDHIPVKDINFEDKKAIVNIKNNILVMEFLDNELVFYDGVDGNILESSRSGTAYSLEAEKFSGYTFSMTLSTSLAYKRTIRILYNSKSALVLNVDENNAINLASPYTGETVELDRPKIWGINGTEKLGSARGYIWSRSLPLMMDNLIFGMGPDNYIFEFPQEDYLGKQYAYDNYNMVVSKPHNLFLQVLLNNGAVAFIAFMTIILKYIIDCFKLYGFKSHITRDKVLGVAIFLSVIGYLCSGIFNDSLVLTAPIFWIILGAGIGTNLINKSK